MLENHLKIIDLEKLRLFDLLTEPAYDLLYENSFGFSRSLNTYKNRVLILCRSPDGKSSYL